MAKINELSMIYDEVGNGIKVRSCYNWYEFREKSNKFFFNIEKKLGYQNTLRNIISKNGELTDLQQINRNIFSFYQDLFSKKCNADKKEINSFLENLPIPKLSNFQKENCEGVLGKKYIFESIRDMINQTMKILHQFCSFVLQFYVFKFHPFFSRLFQMLVFDILDYVVDCFVFCLDLHGTYPSKQIHAQSQQ